MQPPHQHLRMDLTELKAQIMKKLGPEVARHYFLYLNRFLSVKMSKVDFDALCFRILGWDNILLHNQFIRSILKNACTAKSPPPKKNDILKHSTQFSGKKISADAFLENGSHTSATQDSGLQGLSNEGDMLPLSPRKARTSFREQKTGDTLSALGHNGKTSLAPLLSNPAQLSDFNIMLENENLSNHQGLVQHGINAIEVSVPMYSKNKTKSSVRTNGKDAMASKNKTKSSARIPLQALLGVLFFPVSIGRAQRALPLKTSSKWFSTSADGALLHNHTLRERMEHIASAQNLEGVSAACANVLNHGLDSYLKRLIRSCIEFVGVRSGNNDTNKHMKLVNAVRPGFQYQIQNSGKISLQNFRVAMELNPRQLGEDWSL